MVLSTLDKQASRPLYTLKYVNDQMMPNPTNTSNVFMPRALKSGAC